MHTLSFLQTILPSQGTYVAATIKGDYVNHYPCDTIEALADKVSELDRPGYEVYHACASYEDGTLPPNNGLRKQHNVAFVRSAWADIDVGKTKPYKTQREAVAAIDKARKALDLPLPMVVNSGRGLHIYWVYDDDIAKPDADPIATALAAGLKANGLAVERTSDLASILRTVGATWRKREPNRPVTLLRDADPIIPIERMQAAVKPYRAYTSTGRPRRPADEWSARPVQPREGNYPESSAHNIVKHCAALRAVKEAGGAVAEPLWRAMGGVMRYTIEGEALFHEWSQGDARYDAEEAQRKLDGWNGNGAASCAHIESVGGACAECPHRGKINSPIRLGYVEPETKTERPKLATLEQRLAALEQYANKEPDELPFWDPRYRWDGEFLRVAVKDEDDLVSWERFCNKLVYPYMRVRQEDGTSCFRVCSKGGGKDAEWRTFEIPTSALADKRQLASYLASHEVFLTGKYGVIHMQAHMQDIIGQLEGFRLEARTTNEFGWCDNGFILGSTLITPKDEFPVIVGEQVAADAKHADEVRGTVEGWAEAIDTVYNRPGAEPYQFVILAALASPLIELTDNDLWHGIPIALTGRSGLGKSTVCQVAASAFGPPSAYLVPGQNTTYNALIQRVVTAHNVPIILDEVHQLGHRQLSDLLYVLSSGQPKGTLTQDRRFRHGGSFWNLLPLVTANLGLTGLLAQTERNKAEATQLRCFEIPVESNFNADIFTGIDAKGLIERNILSENYGAAGRRFLQAVMARKEAVAEAMRKARAKYVANDQETTRERFYYDVIASVIVAGKIARKLGLVNFDLKAVERWAVRHIRTLRDLRMDSLSSFDEQMQGLLSELSDKIIVTDRYPRTRSDKITFSNPHQVRTPLAREVRQDGTLIITYPALREWCQQHLVPVREFLEDLARHEYTVPPAKYGVGAHGKMYPFRGVEVAANASQTRCVILNLSKMREDGARYALDAVQPGQSPDQSQAVG